MAKANQDQDKSRGAQTSPAKGRSAAKKSSAKAPAGGSSEGKTEKATKRPSRSSADSAGKSKSTPRRKTGASKAAELSHEEVSRRAYEIYEARGGEDGRSEEDWAEAERQLRGE